MGFELFNAFQAYLTLVYSGASGRLFDRYKRIILDKNHDARFKIGYVYW
jgi:hypothetical protein